MNYLTEITCWISSTLNQFDEKTHHKFKLSNRMQITQNNYFHNPIEESIAYNLLNYAEKNKRIRQNKQWSIPNDFSSAICDFN